MALDEEDQEYERRVLKKYGDLNGELHLVEITRNDSSGLGLSLVGNKDLTTMSIFVNALKEGYPAANCGQIFVGDQLLEVNGQSLQGRSHLNVTPLFNSTTSKKTKILILRSKDFLVHIAVPPTESKFSNDSQISPAPSLIAYRKSLLSSKTLDQTPETNLIPSSGGEQENLDQREPTKVGTQTSKECQHGNTLQADLENDADDEVFCNSHDISALSKSSSETFSARFQHNFSEDLRTRPILPGRVTKIEIKKERCPLGCRIVGGIDMSLRRILVFEIYDGGAAARDGRLKVGDEILEVNGQNTHGMTNAEVVMQLRRLSPSMKLLVARDLTITNNSNEMNHLILKEKYFSCKEFIFETNKRPGRSLGFSVVPVWKDRGVLVANITSHGPEELGGVFYGDEIVSANGIRLEHLPTKEALLTLKTMIGKIIMEIHRADVGLLSSLHNSTDLFLPNSPSSPYQFDSVLDMKKSKNLLKRKLPSCFSNGKK